MIIVFDVGLKGWSKFPNVLYMRNRFVNYSPFLITVQFSTPKTKVLRNLLSSTVLSEDEVIVNFINDLVSSVNDFTIFITSDKNLSNTVKVKIGKVFVYNPRIHILKSYKDPYYVGLTTLTMIKSIRRIKNIRDEFVKKYALRVFKRTHGVVRLDDDRFGIARIRVFIDRFIEVVKKCVKSEWYWKKFSNVNPFDTLQTIENLIENNLLYKIYVRYITFTNNSFTVYTYDFHRNGTLITIPLKYVVEEKQIKGFEKPYKYIKTIWKKEIIKEKISTIVKNLTTTR